MNSSAANFNPNIPNPNSGVADYFAILGIGKTLKINHSKKSTQDDVTGNKDNDEIGSISREDGQGNESNQHDEAQMMERFYREIVEIRIFTNWDKTQNHVHHEKRLGKTDMVEENSKVINRQNQELNRMSYSDTPSNDPVSSNCLHPEDFHEFSKELSVDGLEVISLTAPAGYSSMTDPNSDCKNEWKMGQTFQANLNPYNGLLYEIRSSLQLTPPLSQSSAFDSVSNRIQPDINRTSPSNKYRYPSLLFRDKSIKFIPPLTESPNMPSHNLSSFHVGFRRRGADEGDKAAIANVELLYASIPAQTRKKKNSQVNHAPNNDSHTSNTDKSSLNNPSLSSNSKPKGLTMAHTKSVAKLKRGLATGAGIAAKAGIGLFQRNFTHMDENNEETSDKVSEGQSGENFSAEDIHPPNSIRVPLLEFLDIPDGYNQLVLPDDYQYVDIPLPTPSCGQETNGSRKEKEQEELKKKRSQRLSNRTFLFSSSATADNANYNYNGEGVEAFVDGSSFLRSPSTSPTKPLQIQDLCTTGNDTSISLALNNSIRNHCISCLQFPVPQHKVNDLSLSQIDDKNRSKTDVIPVIAIRYQRADEEERFHEDPAITDIALSFLDKSGRTVLPSFQHLEDEDDEGNISFLSKTSWSIAVSPLRKSLLTVHLKQSPSNSLFGTPTLISKWNLPMGFADAPFAASVLDRFPKKNYKGLPLPEEELPMFCYPTGCRLKRALFRDAPLPKCYGFVVKNERGDSLYVSCVSFMEPLTPWKTNQLNRLSMQRQKTSLPNRRFYERHKSHLKKKQQRNSFAPHENLGIEESSFLVTKFDNMTTFENKTLCLVSRFPHWTAFRRFLSHLHILSGSSSELPLERYISHLLLTVPVPKPGGTAVVVPLSTFSEPMVLEMPPQKDLPLVDLPYQRLFACLDVPMVVTIVMGFLALERKVIIMSTHPSLVLDGCELLRSLLFPFELCAPYVPRLTQPFMSCLEFPGAIFVGIHDDGSPKGLAANVRENIPEDTIIVDLDSGEVSCDSDRYEVLNQCWGIIPINQRKQLVIEIETLCKDAGIIPGQEPLDSQIDVAFNVTIPTALVKNYDHNPLNVAHEQLDDRAVRDAFLRFFCSVLEGYERYLVVPDMDFLISGNEWFDSKGFLAAAPHDKASFLGSLITTQLFQSFIQRRTEASDLHCMLFDDCQVEFHSSHETYGRLGNVAYETKGNGISFDLLVDQCVSDSSPMLMADSLESDNLNYSAVEEIDQNLSFSDVNSMAMTNYSGDPVQSSFHSLNTSLNSTFTGLYAGNSHQDVITYPSRENLVESSQFIYCIDGHPSFPIEFDTTLFLPMEPEALFSDTSEVPIAILTRSDRELDEASRRRKIATSDGSGLNKQRRCLWQLPKLLASHFLGAWLLCIPAQISQPDLSCEQQTRFLLRAFGALRLLKSRHRLVPDEASYRALMVACGRSKSDRRIELVKLFGLLRSDGIFPSAVTLGQYTRAIAEGFSRRSIDPQESNSSLEDSKSINIKQGSISVESALNSLDGNLEYLEEAGRKWRQRPNNRSDPTINENPLESTIEIENNDEQRIPANPGSQGNSASESVKASSKGNRRSQMIWSPITFSSSFAPMTSLPASLSNNYSMNSLLVQERDFVFVALWSRASKCENCNYIPLDEEVQAGWDISHGDHDLQVNVVCPRCNSSITPKLGFVEMLLDDVEEVSIAMKSTFAEQMEKNVPPQLSDVLPFVKGDSRKNEDNKNNLNRGFVTYLSPPMLRRILEKHIEEFGEEILERDTLRSLDPTVFYNLWWYSLRFSLPLPLPISCKTRDKVNSRERMSHYCAFGSWDISVAIEGCKSGAKCISLFFNALKDESSLQMDTQKQQSSPTAFTFSSGNTMLSYFNLQTYTQSDWDQADLSQLLITLVEACDKRDFRPVLECMRRCNFQRFEQNSSYKSKHLLLIPGKNNTLNERVEPGAENKKGLSNLQFDCYRTILYLVKYQCTTAFHVFFPATSKGCKGYHFWCSTGTPLPIFDRLYRDALFRCKGANNLDPLEAAHYVSDIALGFRCVFGHVL